MAQNFKKLWQTYFVTLWGRRQYLRFGDNLNQFLYFCCLSTSMIMKIVCRNDNLSKNISHVRISNLSFGTCTIKHNVAKSSIGKWKTRLTQKMRIISVFLILENWEKSRLQWETLVLKVGTFLETNYPLMGNLGKTSLA